jgi:phosphopantothenate synthetase
MKTLEINLFSRAEKWSSLILSQLNMKGKNLVNKRMKNLPELTELS